MGYFEWMIAALAGGLGVTWFESRRCDLPLVQVFDTALVGLALGVVGARAGYVALHWAYFGSHLGEALQWWRGGLSWQAGLVLGLLGVAAYVRRKRLPVRTVLDAFAPGLALACALGWLACYSANCAYGAPLWPNQRLWFLAADLPDAYGIQEPRVAVQWLGAGWAMLVGCLLLVAGLPWRSGKNCWSALAEWKELLVCPWSGVGKAARRTTVGGRFALFVCLYSAGLFVLGFVRGDEMIKLNGLRLDQMTDAVLAIVAAVYLIFRRPLDVTNDE